ncbi:MAG: phosphoglycolate phosphatase [Pseudomonadota bacterium]
MKAIVFDLDGTLVDSAPDMHHAASRMLAERCLPGVSLAQVVSFIGNGVPKLVERCLDAANVAADDPFRSEALVRFRALYADEPTERTRPYPGVPDLLQDLRTRGQPLGICTNKPVDLAHEVLQRLELAAAFDCVIGGGSLAVLKPDPAPLYSCLEVLNAPVDGALFVGDSETDAATARAAGVSFALYSGGYRKSPVEAFDGAFVFDDFAALGTWIERA